MSRTTNSVLSMSSTDSKLSIISSTDDSMDLPPFEDPFDDQFDGNTHHNQNKYNVQYESPYQQPLQPPPPPPQPPFSPNQNPYCNYNNQYPTNYTTNFQTPNGDKILKSLNISVHQSQTTGNIRYTLRIDNFTREFLPEYITKLPGANITTHNSPKNPDIYVEQTYHDIDNDRNDRIIKYLKEITSLHHNYITETMVMPQIGTLNTANGKKLKRNHQHIDELEIKSSDTNNEHPKKKRKLSQFDDIDATHNNDNNDNYDNYDNLDITSDWRTYGQEKKSESIHTLKDRLLSELAATALPKCSHCKQTLDVGDGEYCAKCDEYTSGKPKDVEEGKGGNVCSEIEFEVKRISGKIVMDNGDEYYLTEWKDWELSAVGGATWEPATNFDNSEGKIKYFKNKVKVNENTLCQHKGYRIMPCWACSGNTNTGFKDLTEYGIQYKCRDEWFRND